MEFNEVIQFLATHHRGLISTKTKRGSIHSSVVVCGPYKGNAAFVSVYPRSQKIKNLRRDDTCTVLAVSKDWTSYVSIEGRAKLYDYVNTDSRKMHFLLREVYMACSNTPHPDWEDFDKAMVRQEAVVVLVVPDKIYGLLR